MHEARRRRVPGAVERTCCIRLFEESHSVSRLRTVGLS
ncbi:hypothetical protein A3768_1078 [Ralstonia solanacearum]|nr:hypothetical protein A3768_1078 [Ralstonia solanacearum]